MHRVSAAGVFAAAAAWLLAWPALAGTLDDVRVRGVVNCVANQGLEERFTKLQTGEGDLLARNSTWTLSRDSDLALDFVGVNYYDGQGCPTSFPRSRWAPRSGTATANGPTSCAGRSTR